MNNKGSIFLKILVGYFDIVRFQGYFIPFKVKFFDRIVDFSISRRNIPDLTFVGLSFDSHLSTHFRINFGSSARL